MPLNNSDIDPYEHGERTTYECPSCGARKTTADAVIACPECGDTVRNLSVARE